MSRNYQTRQQDAVAAFFMSKPEDCFTAEDVYRALCDEDIGKTTVYRAITRLCDSGELRRYSSDGGAASYQYNRCMSSHMHMRCTGCGKVFHLHCEDAHLFGQHLLDCHGFILDEGQTILYGKCADCAASKGANQ